MVVPGLSLRVEDHSEQTEPQHQIAKRVSEGSHQGLASVESDRSVAAHDAKTEHCLANGLAKHGQAQPQIEERPHCKGHAVPETLIRRKLEGGGKQLNEKREPPRSEREAGCDDEEIDEGRRLIRTARKLVGDDNPRSLSSEAFYLKHDLVARRRLEEIYKNRAADLGLPGF